MTEEKNYIISVGDSGSSSILMSSNAGAKPSRPVQDNLLSISREIETWGADNLEPQHLLTALKSNPVLSSAMDWMVRALYNGGLEYGYEETDESGKKKFIPQSITEIDAILKASNHKRQAVMGFKGLKTTSMVFPEVILSKDRKKVVMVNFNDSTYCRLSKANAEGRNEYCHISANWEMQYGNQDNKYGITVPFLDDTYNELEALKEGKAYKYVLSGCNMPTLGNSYYSEPVWNSLRTSKWLDYTNQIPVFKTNYLKNATHIKYAVHVPESWWEWKYKDWDTIEAKKRAELVKKEHQRFDTFLRGIENAGKSLMLTFRSDPNMISGGYTKWDIQVIDKKVIDNILGGDLLDTTQMIYQALGVHSTLLGGAPGASNLGAGSGSDQREAYNIFMALSTIDQDIICKPFELMAEYNGLPNLKFRFNSRLIANLSDVTPSKRVEQN